MPIEAHCPAELSPSMEMQTKEELGLASAEHFPGCSVTDTMLVPDTCTTLSGDSTNEH
ncbi:hypothetical protein [Mycobacterium sp.]|uniref:hypothetical protein n=1 Tax=Mycobacterium sp. TaxID=1785 RepID=UPI0025F9D68E|nr:hypothetical protein [Mycobacterium sp.]